MLKKLIAAQLCAIACLSTAQAHITLEQKSAVAGSSYKAVFRVPHGCDGSPTTSLTVFLPEEFVDAQAKPKEGWKLDSKTAKFDQADGSTVRTTQFSWSGGRLLNSDYDEFVVTTTLPATPGKRWIHVLQGCEQGQTDWASIPVEGQPAPRFPAPALDITAPGAASAPAPAMPEHQH
jgi:uncharacterized protein YcnI